MAQNPYVNKVTFNGETVMDISDTTATESDVASGKYFYKASGEKVAGTSSGGGGGSATIEALSVTQNGTYTASGSVDGYSPVTVNVSAPAPTIESLSVTSNGTYTAPSGTDGYSPVVVNVPTGLTNVVTGTFKGTTTGAAIDVTLNYTGSGYPVAVTVYPEEGAYKSSGTFYSLVQRYVIDTFSAVKANPSTTPDYSATDEKNNATIATVYKNSTSSATTYTRTSSMNTKMYSDAAATASSTAALKIRSATKMSVFIAASSYGFVANHDYRYWIIYSS